MILPRFQFCEDQRFLTNRSLPGSLTAAPRSLIPLALSLSGLFEPRTAAAGGGPENVLLLVNSNSASSQYIANTYIQLRKIPPCNVVYVDWKGSVEECGALEFRDGILALA